VTTLTPHGPVTRSKPSVWPTGGAVGRLEQRFLTLLWNTAPPESGTLSFDSTSTTLTRNVSCASAARRWHGEPIDGSFTFNGSTALDTAATSETVHDDGAPHRPPVDDVGRSARQSELLLQLRIARAAHLPEQCSAVHRSSGSQQPGGLQYHRQ
jgi:hypothetical protein